MTNETTASQPKSIGDDAQFFELVKNVAERYGTFIDNINMQGFLAANAALNAYVDHLLNSRAPAAQASATIQAAPLPAERTPNSSDPRDEAHAAGWNACLAEIRSAATIQEPVMVAEPVGDGLPPEVQKLFDQLRPEIDYWCAHRRESNLAALDAIEFRFKVSQARTVRLESTALAAPMVADPAGVALQDLLTAEFECYRPTYPHGLLVWARNALLDTSPHRAATVKAVPSEALDAVSGQQAIDALRTAMDQAWISGQQRALMVGFFLNEWNKRVAVPFTPVPSVAEIVNRFLGWELPHNFSPDNGIQFHKPDDAAFWPIGTNLFTADEAKAMFEFVLAAPLADKTGGGE